MAENKDYLLGIKLNRRCSLVKELSLFSHLLLSTSSSLLGGIIAWKNRFKYEINKQRQSHLRRESTGNKQSLL